MKLLYIFSILIVFFFSTLTTNSETMSNNKKTDYRVKSLSIKILSTMVADSGIGEWGFAALVEADGYSVLFDTGALTDTVLKNARELNVNLAQTKDVILSHNHSDHTGGLLRLRREYKKQNPTALSQAHVGRGIFWSRPLKSGAEGNDMFDLEKKYKILGGKFIEHTQVQELAPGVWLTGAIPRIHPEKNVSGSRKVKTPEGVVIDNIPEELSLVINTESGLVVISGCGHAGIINTLEHARSTIRNAPILAAIGGFHLFEATDEHLDWTAKKLKEFGTKNFIGAHCTGLEAVYRIRQKTGLERKSCVVGAVGASFTLDKGIDPLDLAK
ncbi:MAG: MBL fold metallo-hydrolase [Acidobacteria bacterium]|nr:MBL fold metallo-hydrolase [Acidobacteriota bacterium]